MALKSDKRPKYFKCCPQQDLLYLVKFGMRGVHTISGMEWPFYGLKNDNKRQIRKCDPILEKVVKGKLSKWHLNV